jgi:hypothetical protein
MEDHKRLGIMTCSGRGQYPCHPLGHRQSFRLSRRRQCRRCGVCTMSPIPVRPGIAPQVASGSMPPPGEFPVTYGNEHQYGCFGEVYGDRLSIPPGDSERLLSCLQATTPLCLIDLSDGELLKALHPQLDGRISSAIHYTVTEAWSLALHEWYPEAHGIRYVARHATPYRNHCLFLDRCDGLLTVETEGRLKDLHDLVVRACDVYALAPRLFEPRDLGDW